MFINNVDYRGYNESNCDDIQSGVVASGDTAITRYGGFKVCVDIHLFVGYSSIPSTQ